MDLRLCRAIARRELLMFAYRGSVRVAEPHLYGVTTTGREAVSAWMRPGWSRTDPDGGWRMFLLEELSELAVLPERFAGAREGFNPADPHFVEVYCGLDAPADGGVGARESGDGPAGAAPAE